MYRYDLETKKTEQLTDNLWGINSIIPRENDYIVVGVPQTPDDSKEFMLWSVDRDTNKIKQIEIPHDKHKDMSVWQHCAKKLQRYLCPQHAITEKLPT